MTDKCRVGMTLKLKAQTIEQWLDTARTFQNLAVERAQKENPQISLLVSYLLYAEEQGDFGFDPLCFYTIIGPPGCEAEVKKLTENLKYPIITKLEAHE